MKGRRQSEILNLIKNYEIETQEDLANKLRGEGFKVTQATVSRDIRELKLNKINSKSGAQKYVAPSQYDQQVSEKLIRVFKDALISMEKAQNILVIKTLTGMGNAVAAAIDAHHYEEIVGTLAGDDTIFCAVSCESEIDGLIDKFQQILSS